MESLFTSTTVLLTSEYIQQYPTTDLLSKLSKVRSATGIRYSKAKDTYALSGTWEQVNAAFELLQQSLENEQNEPSEILRSHHFTDAEYCIDSELETDAAAPQEHSTTDLKTNAKGIPNQISDKTSENAYKHSTTVGHSESVIQEHRDPTTKRSQDKTVQHPEKRDKINADGRKDKLMGGTVPGHNTVKPNVRRKKSIQNSFASIEKTNKRNPVGSSLGTDLNPHRDRKINTRSSKSLTKNETVRNTGKKENKTDKENQWKETNISIAEEKTADLSDYSKQKVNKKPGEKGYWSRVKIANYNEKHTCGKCGVTLKSRKRYMEHIRRIHVKEFQCDVCFRRFGYPTDLHRHKCPGIPDPENKCKAKGGRPRKVKSTEPVSLPCQECDYVGTSQKRLNGHIKRTHRLTHACDTCDKKFGFIRDLERHKLGVHTDTYFFCDRCSKCYKSKPVFEMHLKTHEEGYIKPKFACETCGKLFTTKYALNAHNKMEHLGMKREYLCQVCGKKFRQRNSYKQHMNAHNGVKPYVCTVCGKGFTYHKSLKEHKYMHDNIRRFQCNLCDKTFRQRTTLQIHMKVHKTVKDYTCSRCGKGFSQKQALERHERIHTGIKPYTCVPCQRTFGDASTIRRHMKAIHQKTEYNWREEIICNLKRKTDYYVLGGTGQNRTYKSKCKTSDSTGNEVDTFTNHTEVSNIPPIESAPTTDHPALSVPQTDMNHLEYKADYTYTELNNLHTTADPQSNGLASGVYGITSSQLNHSSLNSMNYGDGAIQVVDFTSLPQPIAQVNPTVSKIGMEQDHLSQLQQQTPDLDPQNTNLLSSVSLIPGASVSESVRASNLPSSNQTNNSDTTLNQTLASLWGIMGYPTYYTTNLTQYQGSQNP